MIRTTGHVLREKVEEKHKKRPSRRCGCGSLPHAGDGARNANTNCQLLNYLYVTEMCRRSVMCAACYAYMATRSSCFFFFVPFRTFLESSLVHNKVRFRSPLYWSSLISAPQLLDWTAADEHRIANVHPAILYRTCGGWLLLEVHSQLGSLLRVSGEWRACTQAPVLSKAIHHTDYYAFVV